jgi:vacuolar protein sorting-associated protein 13A/C
MDLVQSIPRVLDSNEPLDELDSILPTPPASTGDPSPEPSAPTAEGIDTPAVDLGPELGNVARGENGEIIRIWKTLDLAFSVSSLSLELFDAEATDQASLKEKSIASFALISTRVNFKMLSDGAMDAEVMVRLLSPLRLFRFTAAYSSCPSSFPFSVSSKISP